MALHFKTKPTTTKLRSVDRELPRCKLANGVVMQASQCLWLHLSTDTTKQTEAVPFYVFSDLPTPAILGHDTCEEWRAEISWATKMFTFTPEGQEQSSLPWKSREGPHWRGSINLIAKKDYVVPPRSQQKIDLSMERGALRA